MGNKSQAVALESIMYVGAKFILGCCLKTCNEAVEGILVWKHYKVVGIVS